MSYFCTMKSLDMKTRAVLVLLMLAFTVFAKAAETVAADGLQAASRQAEADSAVHVSLLTCSPHNEVYSLYGHTALRYRNDSNGVDVAVNYGVFSFKEPNFVMRFVFGLTDYMMGVEPFEDFCREYAHYGSQVTEQELNLTAKEKQMVAEALNKNALPENIRYRYNFLYNNCTTKARDILLDNLNGKVVYGNETDTKLTFRDIIHSCNKSHRWARFGNDLLMGVKADGKTTRTEQQFLPDDLMKDFASATVVRNGVKEPLVKRTAIVVEGAPAKADGEEGWTDRLCPTPLACSLIIFCAVFLVSKAEKRFGRRFWVMDAILTFAAGVAGLVLTAMIFSQHPTVSLNLQILLLNPVMLYFTWLIVKNRNCYWRTRKMWIVVAILCVDAIGCSFFQDFAEGMVFLALSLLNRSLNNFKELREPEEIRTTINE